VAQLPKLPCRRCGAATPNKNKYCDDHQQHAVGWLKTQVGRTTKQRGYAGVWVKLRKLVIARDKVCVNCSLKGYVSPIEHVDHEIPKALGGTDDLDNLQGLCAACHKEKTAREAKHLHACAAQ
jgi:5-methylcytosine-specific restriction enzyme A